MGYCVGSGFFGSADILTSTANQEIIQQHKTGNFTLHAYKLSFFNYNDCHVKINGSDNPIFLYASQGFNTDIHDVPIWSFIIVDSGISYNYFGAY